MEVDLREQAGGCRFADTWNGEQQIAVSFQLRMKADVLFDEFLCAFDLGLKIGEMLFERMLDQLINRASREAVVFHRVHLDQRIKPTHQCL